MQHIYDGPMFGENWFTFPNLYSRFVKELSDGAKIVEVGCWKGKSVAYLGVEVINSGKKISIDAVDTWLGSANEDPHLQDVYVRTNTLYQLFLSNIAPVSSVVNPVRMTSLEASKLYEDESIDVVFLDAEHTYDAVKSDISAWLPKVKRGGYLSGHDYYWGQGQPVKKAVDEQLKSIEFTEECWVYRKP